jgi:hypothetical protein
LEILTWPVEEIPPPLAGSKLANVKAPFAMDRIGTDEIPDVVPLPDPIPASHPLALILPSRIVKFETVERSRNAYPLPIPALSDPVALIFPSKIVRLLIIDSPLPV